MPTKDNWTLVLKTLDLLVAEIRHLRAAGPHFLIVHRFRMPGNECGPGEEVFAVLWIFRGHKFQLRLSTTLLLLFDYLAHHLHTAQNAKQIELGVRADPFYREHAKNASGRPALVRRIPRSAVREHVKRLRRALTLVFRKANLPLDPNKVVVIKQTVGNEVQYQLKATCRTIHIDLTSRDHQPLWR
jgi:hypothetical protein